MRGKSDNRSTRTRAVLATGKVEAIASTQPASLSAVACAKVESLAKLDA